MQCMVYGASIVITNYKSTTKLLSVLLRNESALRISDQFYEITRQIYECNKNSET